MDAGVFVRVLDLALRESVSHVHRGLALRLHALRAVHSTWQPAAQRSQRSQRAAQLATTPVATRLPIYGEDLKRGYQNHTIGQLPPHPSALLHLQHVRSS